MLPKYSVQKPYTIAVAVVLIIVLGIISFTQMTTDLLPAMEMPYVIVVTAYPGASPEKVEQMVTRPLEAALGISSGLQNISSVSSENSSMIILEYVQDTNMDSAIIELSNTIDLVEGQLDEAVGTPMFLRISPDMIPVMVASVDREGMDVEELSAFTDDVVIPSFERLEGVASVSADGLSDKQIEIVLNDEKIQEYNAQVKEELEKTFAENLESLENAQTEITDGLAKLNSESASQKNQMSQGSAQISNAIANINALLSEEASLQAQKTAFEEERKAMEQLAEMNEVFGQLFLSGIADLSPEMLAPFLEQFSEQLRDMMPIDLSDLSPEAFREFMQQLTQEDNWYQQLFPSGIGDMSPELYQSIMGTLEGKLPNELSGLSQQEMAELEKQARAAPARLAAIDMELQNIAIRQMTLTAMKPQLENSLKETSSAYEKLEAGKVTMAVELAKAQIQLENGQAEIEKGLEEFEKAKEQAFAKADLSEILTQEMVSGLIMAQNFNMPAGYIINEDDRHLVKVGESFASIEELEEMLLFHTDSVGDIRIRDIATITIFDHADEIYAKVNGNNGILLTFQKQSTASTSAVTDAINQEIEMLQQEYGGLRIRQLMDQGDYIHMITDNVIQNLLIGGILAVLLLLIFLRDLRPTIVIAFSIPISLMTAVTLMYFTDITLNVISLSGLALGVGMLVDNSIVVIENIYRMRQEGTSAVKASIEGAKQVSGAIFASTLTTVCVFLPIVFTQGLSRQLFTDMGLTIAYSLLASLVVALTLVPAVGSTLLRSVKEKRVYWFEKLNKFYEKSLHTALNKKAIVLAIVILLLAFGVYGATIMGTAFLGEVDSPQMSATMIMPKDSTRNDAHAMGDEIMNRILKIEAVETVGAMSGGMSNLGFMGSGSEKETTFYILLQDQRSLTNTDVERLIYETTDDLNVELTVSASNMDISVLGGSGIHVNIKGQDLDKLADISLDIAGILSTTEGTVNVKTELEDVDKETRILVNKDKAMGEGITIAQIFNEISSALKTETQATILTEEDKNYPVLLVNPDQEGITKENLDDYSFTVMQQDGEEKEVLLKDIAEIIEADSLNAVRRENQSRYMTVSAEIADGYNIGLVSRDVERNLADYDVPSGYHVSITGENESINETMQDLVLMILLAVVFIYLIMVAQFQSLLSPFIVMFTLPLAFTGGLLLLWVSNMELSVIAMLGFLLLAGVVVNNGIVLISYIDELRENGMNKREALIKAGTTRLRPILLTALTTILAMSTMAMGYGSGAEMVQPMAVVTIGGLTYATLLTLYIVPILYDIFHRKPMRKVDSES